jgi:hypothetical protein
VGAGHHPAGIDITGYQVLVVQEEPVPRVFSADLPATATKLSVPAEFVQPSRLRRTTTRGS